MTKDSQTDLSVEEYYDDRGVRARIHEYCGGTARSAPSAAFLGGLYQDGTPFLTWEQAARVAPGQYDCLRASAPDMARSLWDTRHLIFVLDLDYLNVDAQGIALLHPGDAFLKLEPVYRATSRVLAGFGVYPFRLMTGRGYHFVGAIPLTHRVTAALASLVPTTPGWLSQVDHRRPEGVTAPLTVGTARAAAGLGLLTEYLAHLILRRGASTSLIPIVVNGTIDGRGLLGRECVSIDFSHVGDPLDIRMIRVAFGTYQWHRFREDIFGPLVSSKIGVLASLPRQRRTMISMLLGGRTLGVARQLARTGSAALPDVASGIESVLAGYRRSRLAGFHQQFLEASDEDPPMRTEVPPCVAQAFEMPNDLLLKPEHVQHVVRTLMARGWTPRQIADQLLCCYQSDWHWGDRWTRMHEETRASFEVRVFAGLIMTGLDRLVDYNCVSAQEKGICPGVGCPCDLRIDRDRLLAEVQR